jgi:hypothetical protein
MHRCDYDLKNYIGRGFILVPRSRAEFWRLTILPRQREKFEMRMDLASIFEKQ